MAAKKKTKSPQKRLEDIADELTSAAGRLRDVFDVRPASGTDIDALRAELAALARRVDALEKAAKPAPRRAPARKAASTAASKVPAARAAAKR
jgi:hypothetical protein